MTPARAGRVGHRLGDQETDVVVVEQAHVGDAPRQHRGALDAHAEGEARVALGVDPAVAQHLGMDHAAAEELEPAAVFAHAAAGAAAHDACELELQRRLGEREVVRAPLQRRARAEERSREILEGPLEVAHRDPLVDAEPLDLVKHRHVGGVVIAAIRLAGDDHPLRRTSDEHAADLHRRGVGAEQPRIIDVERVLRIARGVSGRLVDQREVVAVVFNLGALDALEAELGEDPPHLAGGERHRAQAAATQWRRGPGEIERLHLQALRPSGALDGALAFVEGIADPLDQLVDHLPHLAAPVRVGDLAEAAPKRGQHTVTPTEIPGPHRVERGEVRRGGDCLEGFRRHAVEVGGHALVRAPRATSTSC